MSYLAKKLKTKRMLSSVLLLLLTSVSLSLGDYGGSVSVYDYELAFWDEKVDYVGALVKCETHQIPGWLAEIKDPDLQQGAELAVYGNNYVWIGATDLSAEGNWLWLDGTDLYWTHWEAGEPNNLSDEDCMLMLNTGEWNDKDCCYRPDGYVCQSYIDGSYKFGYSEFDVITSPLTYWQAKETCATNGGKLVEITDSDSEINLRKIVTFNSEKLWISRMENELTECATIDAAGVEKVDCSGMKSGALCEKVRPHAVKIPQHKLSIPIEARMEVECTADGFPAPETAWYKDGKELLTQVKSPGKSKLVLEDAKTDDAGLYLCYATNDVNKDKYDVKTFMNLEVTEA